ncbi:MAG TPA: hypothetical protein VEX15_21805, partial [Nocardioidaceae bacterium]|nr:hypothetical protein [Nocardioidaceae bacterium]
MTVVEFGGLPGTGKTTLAGLVADELAERDLHGEIADAAMSAAVSRSRRLQHKTVAIARQVAGHPVRTTSSAWWIAGSRQESARDAVAGLAQWVAVQRAITAAGREPGVQLLDLGLGVEPLGTTVSGRASGQPLANHADWRLHDDQQVRSSRCRKA